jgi:hypothetical protein
MRFCIAAVDAARWSAAFHPADGRNMGEALIESHRALGEAICRRLRAEISKLGFTAVAVEEITPVFGQARFTTSRDPYSGNDTLCGYWHDANGQRCGEMKFHADGTFFAEYDVVRPHPRDPRWFVEGVAAWGRDPDIKAEPKLLPNPGQ